MKYPENHLARMNRSGRRRGAVGSKPTVCTRILLDLKQEGLLPNPCTVFDFGAGKWAQQAQILRDEGFQEVIPYDIGTNSHGTELKDLTRSDVVLMSNVLNVQPSMQDVRRVLITTRSHAQPSAMLVCNLPKSPRYGNVKEASVWTALSEAGWTIIRRRRVHGGTAWVCTAL